jgi:hypothetical protein
MAPHNPLGKLDDLATASATTGIAAVRSAFGHEHVTVKVGKTGGLVLAFLSGIVAVGPSCWR